MEDTNEYAFNTNSISSNDQDGGNVDELQNGFKSIQFNVLDEISEGKNSGSDNESDYSDSYDSEVPDEEIEAMLEEGLPEEFRERKRRRLNDNSGKLLKIMINIFIIFFNALIFYFI